MKKSRTCKVVLYSIRAPATEYTDAALGEHMHARRSSPGSRQRLQDGPDSRWRLRRQVCAKAAPTLLKIFRKSL
eukprot:7857095-Pyramimonas_sp.AAC.1